MIPDPAPARSPRWRRALGWWPVRDALPAAALAAAGAALADAAPVPVQDHVQQALTLAAAAGAAAAAILLVAGARLAGDAVALRLGAGLLVYGGVVLPVTVGLPTGGLLDLACAATVAALFAAALTGRPVVPRATVLAAVAGTGLVALLPPPARVVALDAVVLAWGAVGVLLVLRGARRKEALVRRAGLGVCLLAAAAASPTGAPQSVLRVVGVGVVLLAAVSWATAALRRQRAEHAAAARRLRAAQEAERAADREAAERAHEMRNVVVGLSGAANLFTSGDATGHEALARALQAELGRLTELLDSDGAERPSPEPPVFPVEPVLRTAVALQRARGTAVELDVAGDPVAAGSSPALSQAVTNLLLNCERHAPGARVRVAARRDAGRVEVLVSDDGPGVPRGAEHRALRRGWKGAASTGSGLGLDISRRALREQGGDLRLLPPSPDAAGCRVVVELRAADRGGLTSAAAGPSGGSAAGRSRSR